VCEWGPTASDAVVVDAEPAETAAVPRDVAPSKNSTLPAVAAGVIVAVSVTLWPTTDGFGELASDVVVEPWSVNTASLASFAVFAWMSTAAARTSAVALGLLGTVQLNEPEFASPLATGSQLEPLFTEYSSVMPLAATPSGSVAVQVIACDEPAIQVSPPFGDVTATLGVERSTDTVAAVPMAEPSVAFEQSRSVTEVMVTLPLPPSSVEPTPSENSVPLVALDPHGVPSVTPSTVKLPPPLSMTWNEVLAPLADRKPPSVIALDVVVSPESWSVTE
jgi:hypothetical protein